MQRPKLKGRGDQHEEVSLTAAGTSVDDFEGKRGEGEKEKVELKGYEEKKPNRKKGIYLYTVCVFVVCAQSGLTLSSPFLLPINQPYYL